MSEHEREDGPVVEPIEIRDLVGIMIGGVGAVVGNIGQCLTLISSEFMSAGQYARRRKEAERQRREVGYALERIVEGDQ